MLRNLQDDIQSNPTAKDIFVNDLGISEEDLSKDYEVTYYSGSNRKRNSSSGWFYKPMIKYIRTFAPGGTITDQVTAWARTRHSDKVDPLTDDELKELKQLMLE